MKIGVISSYAWVKIANNYGALLQYYALQEYLRHRGHYVFWLKYILKEPIFKVLLKELYHSRSLVKLIRYCLCHRYFMSFIKKYLDTSAKTYTTIANLNEKDNDYDAFITGSDQVWGGTLAANYLTFVHGKPKIAYAASFGKDTLSKQHSSTIAPWLKSFNKISVREKSGIDICSELGVYAEHLLDPTLLLYMDDYPSNPKKSDNDYVFSYFLNAKSADDLYLKKIECFIKEHNLRYYVTAIQGTERFIPSDYLVYPKPSDWLSYYKYSKFVITNTFHGTVFALIYHRPFISILQKGKLKGQNNRIYSLLEMFDLTERLWDGCSDINSIILKDIDWDSFEIKRSQYIKMTDNFFEECEL